MKTFFSIMHLTINASLNEKVSIGLIMSDGENFIFKVSYQKFNILKPLITQQNYVFLKSYFKNLDYELNFDYQARLQLDVKKETSKSWVNTSYFSYLSKYSNNIVKFSEPKSINADLSNFEKLFHLYVYEKDDVELLHSKERDIINKTRETLYPKIRNRVNIDATVSPSDFTELITPLNIGFIGKNDVLVAGQTIDFNKSSYFLDNDVNKFISFTKAADYKNARPGKYYLVGEEPSKNENKNHNLWKAVKESKMVDYVSINEVEIINEYMTIHDVSPFFEKEIDNG